MIQHLKESRHELVIGFGGRILTGIIVALLIVGVQVADRAMEKREQQEETKNYAIEMEKLVNSDPVFVSGLEAVIGGSEGTVLSFEEVVRLRRFVQALESLELHLAARGTQLSPEDSFAIQKLILSYSDQARAAEELWARLRESERADVAILNGSSALLSDRFFKALRDEVDWLGK